MPVKAGKSCHIGKLIQRKIIGGMGVNVVNDPQDAVHVRMCLGLLVSHGYSLAGCQRTNLAKLLREYADGDACAVA